MKRPLRPKRTRLRASAKSLKKQRPTLSDAARKELEGKIGYAFKDPHWLTRALTHPSLIDNYDGDAQFSNQRLEFLGDRVLGLVMAEILSEKHPKEREGFLTKVFHKLVSGETCALVGEQFHLRDYMFFDESMRQNRQGSYDKPVGDGVESLIAAIYRDGGLAAATKFIKTHWIFDPDQQGGTSPANPKTRLSDWCGQHRAPYAAYKTISQSGPAHAPVFTVQVEVEGHGSSEAKGSNKQEAEMAAAEALLEKLEEKHG